MPPTLANGKICYIEMPATDIAHSSDFYKKVFGWNVRKRGDGSIAFDDTTGEVSGTGVLGRPPSAKPGLLFYIMVDSVAATVDAVVVNGGEIVQPVGVDAPEITARFRDPGGNVIGLYQQPARPSTPSAESHSDPSCLVEVPLALAAGCESTTASREYASESTRGPGDALILCWWVLFINHL
jgi:predicted enzyme related to lactoylglutathione lyase